MNYVHCNTMRSEVFHHSEVEAVTSRMVILFPEHYENNSVGNERILSIVQFPERFLKTKYTAPVVTLSQYILKEAF